jgi:hypothetical protein
MAGAAMQDDARKRKYCWTSGKELTEEGRWQVVDLATKLIEEWDDDPIPALNNLIEIFSPGTPYNAQRVIDSVEKNNVFPKRLGAWVEKVIARVAKELPAPLGGDDANDVLAAWKELLRDPAFKE